MEIKKGIPVSPGVSVGKAYLLDSEEYAPPQRLIEPDEIVPEINRLEKGLAGAIRELHVLYKSVTERLKGEIIPILEAHIKMLEDPYLKKQIVQEIKEHSYNAEYAVSVVFRKYTKALMATENEFLASRVQDIYDVERRLLRRLFQKKLEALSDIKEEVVIIAQDLMPTQTISLERHNVKGFATDTGGRTSHTAIIARSLGIPAVVGVGDLTSNVNAGETVIVDGTNGIVIIAPDEETLKKYDTMAKSFFLWEKKIRDEVQTQPTTTKDGYDVQLYANIDAPSEVLMALRSGADGVGLVRTEFLYDHPERLPTEREHFEIYKKIVLQMKGREVIIRTIDIGADKLSLERSIPEKNPFLGCRSIRLALEKRDIFKDQMRAICRAADFGNISIMFPMISTMDEVKMVKTLCDDVKAELKSVHQTNLDKIKVGIMIEVPSAALIADLLIKEVDFFSIGTNDLIQYTIAVDRSNERVANLYQPTHPAILRLVTNILEVGRKNNKPVAMCGEMAGDPLYTILLVGLGLKIFSMAPMMIPEIKKVIRGITFSDAQKIAHYAVEISDTQKSLAYLKEQTARIIPQLF